MCQILTEKDNGCSISSACVVYSAVPSCMKSTWSISGKWYNLWVIHRITRSDISSFMFCRIFVSVFLSTAASGSSSIRIDLACVSVLASASLACCPPDNCVPAAPIKLQSVSLYALYHLKYIRIFQPFSSPSIFIPLPGPFADTIFYAYVSSSCLFLDLQMQFDLPATYSYILKLLILRLKDTFHNKKYLLFFYS